MPRKKTSISLEAQTYKKLQDMAEVAERSISQQVAFLVKVAEVVRK